MLSTSTVITAATLVVPLVLGSPLVIDNKPQMAATNGSEIPVRWMNKVIAPQISQSVGQAYFWTENWQNQEKAALEDLRTNNFSNFASAEDAIAWLFDDEA